MTYFFDLLVSDDLTGSDGSGRPFGAFGGDVTPAVRGGIPVVLCSVDAASVEGAVQSTVARLRDMGVRVTLVQFEPTALAA